MKATVLLADSAQADPSGKVHALGLGWSTTTTPTPPHALIVMIDVGWDETNKPIAFHAELVDGDGRPVTTATPLGDQPIAVDGNGEAGRAPGMPPGTEVRIPIAFGMGPGLQLTVGQRYEWRVTIDGQSHADWCASFTVTG